MADMKGRLIERFRERFLIPTSSRVKGQRAPLEPRCHKEKAGYSIDRMVAEKAQILASGKKNTLDRLN